MKKTLAVTMRPESLSEVLGQEHIIGQDKLLNQFIKQKHPFSTIFFGPPGCGKTTIASALANDLGIHFRLFNASTSNKKDMDQIIEEAKISEGLFVIIDEIHRLNKDKQDHLLPHVESGLLTIIGCTTANPFHSINPAIRSRCHIIEIKPLNNKHIIQGLNNALTSKKALQNNYTAEDEALQKIASLSSGDIRYAYNCLEICSIVCKNNHITLEDIKTANFTPNQQFDKGEDQYYDTLSGLQKSIRGSDVNGALYYFAKLIEANDIASLERRLITIAYEDIGLGNPNACMRTVTAMQAAKIIGFPEARIPIANVIIDLCLSPKSKSSEISIDRAIQSVRNHPHPTPRYLRLTPVGLEEDEKYDYNKPELWPYIQYLPDNLSNEQFYTPWLTGQYEKTLATYYDKLLQHGRTNNIKALNNKKRQTN